MHRSLPTTSFFEPSPPPSQRELHRRPEWGGPPENELGISVPTRMVIVQTGALALCLLDITAYSTGLSLRVVLRLHPETEFDPRGMMMQLHGGEGLRFGIEFADGRKATNMRRPGPPDEQKPVIHLSMRGSGGGGGAYDFGFWVYPLPPPGKIVVAAEWEGRFGEVRRELDVAPVLEAAAQSEQLWPDGRAVGSGGHGSSSWTAISPRRGGGRPAQDP